MILNNFWKSKDNKLNFKNFTNTINNMFGAANGMLKEGARHYSGLEEAMMRNIDACQ